MSRGASQHTSGRSGIGRSPTISRPHPAAQATSEPEPPPADDNRSLLASSRTMAIGSLVSRITGFIRTLAIAAALGAAGVGDAFNGANTFPNMVYELLLGGVLTSVIVPLLVNAQEHDKDRGVAYTQRLMSLATVALTIATLLAVAAAPLIARAFVTEPAKRELTSMFATLLLPEIFFYGMAGMFTALLNVKHVFGPGAWAPVVNNVIAILTVGIFLTLPGPHTLLPSTMHESADSRPGHRHDARDRGPGRGVDPVRAPDGIPVEMATARYPRGGGPHERGGVADRLGARIRGGEPGRCRRDHQGRVRAERRRGHQLHVCRSALPGALWRAGGVAAHRADAAHVAVRRSGRHGGGGCRPVSWRETLRRCPDSRDGRVHRSRSVAHHRVVHRADDRR